MEEGGSGGINGASKKHKTFCKDVCGEPQHRVTIDTSVFEVDTCSTISSDNDL